MGKIVIIDNLWRRRLVVVDWCCMCKVSGETPDHLRLQCAVATKLWLFLWCPWQGFRGLCLGR